jgi:ABC-2 type transport system ATP-binding protein
VDGVDPWRQRSAAIGRLGYVPQAASLYRDLTVDDHLALASTLRPGFDREGAAGRLDRLDIPRRARAGELSGGQGAQVGLALALGTRAPILLLDEPLASLDPLARREFLAVLLEAIRQTGATILLSSHIVTDVEQACDRLVVLGGGRVRLDEGLALARATHLVGPIGPIPAGTRPVASFPAEDGTPRQLLRTGSADREGEPAIPASGASGAAGRRDGFAPATLEEIVLGHLSAGRPGTTIEGLVA